MGYEQWSCTNDTIKCVPYGMRNRKILGLLGEALITLGRLGPLQTLDIFENGSIGRKHERNIWNQVGGNE